MKQYSIYNEEKKVHDLENVKLKLKMLTKNSKSQKVSVDDYISNILGSGLNISKPYNNIKVESQSAQNLNSERNNRPNVNDLINSSINISSNYSSFPVSMIETDFYSQLPFVYREIINKVKVPSGELDTHQIYSIFISSGLSKDILGSIWSVINRTSPGQLTVLELSVGLAMVALYQKQSLQNISTDSFIPISWDQVISRGEFPIPKLSIKKSENTSNGINLPNIYSTNESIIETSSVIVNVTENENWADFTSFVTQDQELPPNNQMNNILVSPINITPPVTPLLINEPQITDQPFDIQKQINNQFSNWQTDIKSENGLTNLFQLNNGDHSKQQKDNRKSGDHSTIAIDGHISTEITERCNVDSDFGDFGDFQIFSSDQINKSLLNNNITNNKSLITDRYQIFNSELKDPYNNLIDQWTRCLNQCKKIINDTVNVLSKITDNSIKVDVFNSDKGNLLLSGIIEVYRVTRNIKLSTSKTNILTSSNSLLDVFTKIERNWNDFMLVLPDEMQIDVQTRLSRGAQNSDLFISSDDSSWTECCGVCLCPLNPNEGFLSHGLRRYHCPCANLWVNTLDLTLPGLYLPDLTL